MAGEEAVVGGITISGQTANLIDVKVPVTAVATALTIKAGTPSLSSVAGGALTMSAGDASGGNASGGSASLQVGANSGLAGTPAISIGTVNTANTTIGKSGASTTIVGSFSLSTDQIQIIEGGTGGATADAALYNLINAATVRVPVLTDLIPFQDEGSFVGGRVTLQNMFNLINSLGALTPAYNDKVMLYDADGAQALAVTLATLFGEGKVIVEAYTGSGSSGKTVPLTGINRASSIVICRIVNSSDNVGQCTPNGATGSHHIHFYNSVTLASVMSLDAPAAGTSQTLTINSTNAAVNQSSIAYTAIVMGTPI
jgi:hypothetical protein